MIKVNDINWNNVITSLLPLLGVAIGGLTTYFAQINIENKKEENRKREQKFKIYSDILMKHGESLAYKPVGDGNIEFYKEVYRRSVRPSLYSELYLLDNDIIEDIKEIDWLILDMEKREFAKDNQMTTEEGNALSKLYIKLIAKVVFKLSEY